jgi:DUF1680 family protein
MNAASTTDTTGLSPFAKLHGVGLTDARWTAGFWADRTRATYQGIIPALGRLMEDEERHRFVGNFLVAIGLAEGRHRGPKWDDGDFYKWVESLIAQYAMTRDPILDKHLDQVIDLIGRVQQPDGYIHTPQQIDQRNGGALQRFADPMHFEMYNMGHLITAAVVHHRATGKTTFLDIAKKAADFLDREFADPQPSQARHGICPAHLMALADLYRDTGERKYLALAERLLAMRELVEKGDDDNQDRLPFREHRTAHGHAVRATYLYAGAADLYAETGDAAALTAMNAVWQDLVDRKLYITGGCGALFDGASPDGSADQLNITRVHQAFGRDYQLPHATAHNETCAAIGNLMWNWRMLLITGDAKFADVIEQTLFNSLLAGVNLAGDKFFYTNTLRRTDPMPVELRFPMQREKTLGCLCCPPNVARTMARTNEYAYAVSPAGVHVVLYGGSTLDAKLPDGTPIKLRQQTDYPWDGRVTITIEQAATFTLHIRIPAWANDATVDGKPANGGTFVPIHRRWTAGESITIDLPMPVRLIEANPLVEETRGQVAVVRGPIVYCLESADLPPTVKLLDVSLGADVTFTVQPDPVLANAVALQCDGFVHASAPWSGGLYRELASTEPKRVPIRLVPYFAWDNRGPGEMTVWIPLSR